MALLREVVAVLDRFLEGARLREASRTKAKAEKRLETAMQAAFKKQGDLFGEGLIALKPLQEADGYVPIPEKWRDLFDKVAKETEADFTDPIQEEVEAGVLAAGQAVIKSIGVAIVWNLEDERATAYLDEYAAGRVAELNQTTKNRIAEIIQKGAKEGWSYDKVARAISTEFEGYAATRSQAHVQSRAHLIAVTEVGNAYEYGGYAAAEEIEAAGIEMEKRWLTSGDDRVSAGCKENGKEEWIPLKQAHKSGDNHPLRFPGCRCTELFRRKGDTNE